MNRNLELLSSAVHGLSSTVEAWTKAGVITPDEKRSLHHALWSIVVAAEKANDSETQTEAA